MAKRKKSVTDIMNQMDRIIAELDKRGQYYDDSTNDLTPRARRVYEIEDRYSNNAITANVNKWSKMTRQEREPYGDVMRYGTSNGKINYVYNTPVSYSQRIGGNSKG